MRDYGNAVLRYCPQLKQNVIMEERRGKQGVRHLECLSKGECGYEVAGCRNALIEVTGKSGEIRSEEGA